MNLPTKAALAASLLVIEAHAETALTIYNQQFAVVRESVPVELKAGVNDIAFNGMTALAEPQSVIFRDPTGAAAFTLRTQSYRNDAVSQESLLNLFEGKTIKFLVTRGEKEQVVEGKVIRGADATWLAAQRENYHYQRSPAADCAGRVPPRSHHGQQQAAKQHGCWIAKRCLQMPWSISLTHSSRSLSTEKTHFGGEPRLSFFVGLASRPN